MRDQDGQPLNSAFRSYARHDRELDELIGLCKGIMADGVVNQVEAEFLERWLRANTETVGEWPANVLLPRIRSMLVDGKLDSNEEGELLSLLLKVSGGDATKLGAHSLTTGLPLDDPAPAIEFLGKSFCFTGKFLFGSRARCHQEVVGRSGVAVESITVKLDYLVIGVVGSRDWLHSTFGTKIQKAVEYRKGGRPLAIISEEQFLKALTVI